MSSSTNSSKKLKKKMTLESWLQSSTNLPSFNNTPVIDSCQEINQTVRSIDAIEESPTLNKRKLKKVKIKEEIEIVEMESFKYYNMPRVDTINENKITIFSSSQEYCQKCQCSIF
jgi:hypothetical protein